MRELLLHLFSGIPGPLATILIGTMPLAESRLAVAVGISVYHLHPVLAIVYGMLGDLTHVALLIAFLGPVSGWLIRTLPWTDRIFQFVFKHTRHRFTGKYEKYGLLALTIMVSIPLPGTGSWTAAIASFVFGMPKLRSFLAIAAGVLVAATLIALATTGVVHIYGLALH